LFLVYFDYCHWFFPLPKNLDFSNTSLDGHTGIGREILTISAALFLDVLEFEEGLIFGTLEVNLFAIPFLKELLSLLMSIIFQPDS